MGYIRVPWLLFLCGFGHNQPDDEWMAKSGVRLRAVGKHGTPFGRARLVLLMLAEKAAEAGRSIRLSIEEIRETFGLAWRPKNLEQHIKRVIDCLYERVDQQCACTDDRCHPRRVGLVDFIASGSYCAKDKTFHIELQDAFVEDARQSAACSVDVIKALIREEQFAAFDLYCWYRWRLFRKEYEPVDPFGPHGPFGLFPIAKAGTKARSDLRKLHRIVKRVWPECPFRVMGEGKERQIVYRPRNEASAAEQIAVQSVERPVRRRAAGVPRYRKLSRVLARQRLGPMRISIERTVPSSLSRVRTFDELREEAERLQARLQGMARARGDPFE